MGDIIADWIGDTGTEGELDTTAENDTTITLSNPVVTPAFAGAIGTFSVDFVTNKPLLAYTHTMRIDVGTPFGANYFC